MRSSQDTHKQIELCDEFVTMIPTENREYLREIMLKYPFCKIHSDGLFKTACERIRFFWEGFTKLGVRGGCVFLGYIPELDWYTFDAYRDDRALARLERNDWSFRAANLVLDFFFSHIKYDRIYTMHDERNIRATKICERLGFKTVGSYATQFGKFIVQVKEKENGT